MYEVMIDHPSYSHNLSSCEINAWKKFRPEQVSNPWPLPYRIYQLNYQAIWELVTLWICNTPVEGEEDKWLYERSYIWTGEKNMKWWSIITVTNHDHSWLHILCSSNIGPFIYSFAEWHVSRQFFFWHNYLQWVY